MKNAAILIVGIVIGYFVFFLLNPRPTETFTVKTRTIKQSNTVPIVIRDTRYHGPDSEMAPKDEAPVMNIKVGPVTETKFTIINRINKKNKVEERRTLKKDRIQLTNKIFIGLNQIPFLLTTDSKLVKMLGQYKGTLKFLIAARTGDMSIVNLKITKDETSMTVKDAYDNIDANYTFRRITSEVFKTLPNDENHIILMTNNESSFIFDLRDLPELKGKAFVKHMSFGDVDLKKKQEQE